MARKTKTPFPCKVTVTGTGTNRDGTWTFGVPYKKGQYTRVRLVENDFYGRDPEVGEALKVYEMLVKYNPTVEPTEMK